uniref:Uncharacterized protein n=1 Tax=Anopheles atroparvus TaxID=41427 RepID=A0AAG5DIE1_ANOAO
MIVVAIRIGERMMVAIVILHGLLLILSVIVLVVSSATMAHPTLTKTFSRGACISHTRFIRCLVVLLIIVVLLLCSIVTVVHKVAIMVFILITIVAERLPIFLNHLAISVLGLRNIAILVCEERT